MFLYTRMGFLVPLFWISAMAVSSSILQKHPWHTVFKISNVSATFLTAAAVSAVLCFVTGKLLNQNKEPRTIRPFGRERIVHWGPHTFNMFPVEYWSGIIPAITVFTCIILTIF